MLCVSANFVFAGDVLNVKAVSSISTKYPSDIAVQVKDPATVGNLEVHQGYILYGKMVDAVPPPLQKMGKNAQFSFEILSYRDANGIEHALNAPITIKYRQQMRPNMERSSFTIGMKQARALRFHLMTKNLRKKVQVRVIF